MEHLAGKPPPLWGFYERCSGTSLSNTNTVMWYHATEPGFPRGEKSATNIVNYTTALFLRYSCFFLLHLKQSTWADTGPILIVEFLFMTTYGVAGG